MEEKNDIDSPINKKWPQGITVKEGQDGITITLSETAAGLGEKYKNMQEDAACFEGWAAIFRSLDRSLKITLNAENELPPYKRTKANVHYARFLYRALRFSEQYGDWFSLGDNVKGAVESFEKFLNAGKNAKNLINNSPSDSQAKTSPSRIESIVEEMLANKNKRRAVFYEAVGQSDKNAEVFRQLPVGLFADKKSDGNEVFPASKSAVDLWTIDDDTVRIVELKAANPMVGVITETFFYANFVRDLLNGFFSFNEEDGYISRGYAELRAFASKEKKNVQGVMLANSFDPLITGDVIDVLKKNGQEDLNYVKTSYAFDIYFVR